MHELSIADSIIKTATAEATKRRATEISAVGLRIGQLTDIVEDSLRFGLEVLSKGTMMEKAEIEIESIPPIGYCETCARNIEIRKFFFVCPECNGRQIKLISGNELDIAYIELETDDKVSTEEKQNTTDSTDA